MHGETEKALTKDLKEITYYFMHEQDKSHWYKIKLSESYLYSWLELEKEHGYYHCQ